MTPYVYLMIVMLFFPLITKSKKNLVLICQVSSFFTKFPSGKQVVGSHTCDIASTFEMRLGFCKGSEGPESVQWTEECRFTVHKSAQVTETSRQIQRTQHSRAVAVGSVAADQYTSRLFLYLFFFPP